MIEVKINFKWMNAQKTERILILDNIRSVYNVGSIFRTADAVGINQIYLIGQTPTPIDRFGRARKDLAKVALGAEKNIPWIYIKNDEALATLKKLQEQNVILVAVEQNEKSVNYREVVNKISLNSRGGDTTQKVALIFGNEVDGVSDEILNESDLIAEIPMKGQKESLNVSVSAGILMFEVFYIRI